jgi:HAD superfamily hydrolase (TIGR01509 family)
VSRPVFLFDLDGTLCETDQLHFEAFRRVLSDLGRTLSEEEYSTHLMGFGGAYIYSYLFPKGTSLTKDELIDRKEAAFLEALRELPPLPGLVAFLGRADRAGIAYKVVTNAPRDVGSIEIERMGLTDRLGEPVYGQELPRPKPDPMPYEMGLKLLGGDAARSIGFEDSRSGLRSAKGAGLAVVGLATTLDAKSLLDEGAVLAVRDYTDPRLARLVEARTGLLF